MLSGDSENRSESENLLMRVLFCKIHCPSFVCFCKPSQHIYTSGPLKLENNNPNVAQKIVSVPESDNNELNLNVKEQQQQQQDQTQLPENCLKGSLKKPNSDSDPALNQKKTVQWMDILGKDLVQIREFETCETEYFDYEAEEMNRSCVCVIL